MTTKTDLPRIVRFDGRTDSGEYGNATCPHCGADGRYVQWFYCDDGKKHGAMAGCVNLYPIAPIAKIHQKLIVKSDEYAKKGWNLPSWDQRKLEAINAFYAGDLTEQQAIDAVKAQEYRAREYREKKHGRRAY